MDMHSLDGKTKTDNILVKVTIMLLVEDNFFTWLAAITISIAGQEKYDYIIGLMLHPTWTNPSRAT